MHIHRDVIILTSRNFTLERVFVGIGLVDEEFLLLSKLRCLETLQVATWPLSNEGIVRWAIACSAQSTKRDVAEAKETAVGARGEERERGEDRSLCPPFNSGPRLRGVNFTEVCGLEDSGVETILAHFGSTLQDLCVHGSSRLTPTWMRSLEKWHKLTRINYAGNYRMSDEEFLPLWHHHRPQGQIYYNPNQFGLTILHHGGEL